MENTHGLNVVLVHGGWVDGSGWEGVHNILTRDGHHVSVVQIPTVSLADDVMATRRVIGAQDGRVILVGHSYGGAVITEAGNDPKVAGLVYVAAFAPDKGESVASLIKDPPPDAPVPPILPPQDGYLLLDRTKFGTAFAADVDPEKAAFMADSQVPRGVAALSGSIDEPAWKTKPSWYLVTTEDKMIPPPAQRFMSKRAGSTVTEVQGSHASIYQSQPLSPRSSSGPPAARHSKRRTPMFRSIRNHRTSGRGIAAAYAFILALGLGLSVTAPAAASDSQDRQGPKPTIVFVHGGWADSSSWNQEITNLERRDFTVIAPADPLRDLAFDAAYIRSVLQTISGPIVLVGHSYGGAVITNAAVGVPNVKALVYIAAFAPDKGESLVQLVTMNPGSQIGPATLDFRPYPLPDGGTGTDLYLKKSAFHDAFAGDLPLKVTNQMQAGQRPFANEAFVAPSGDPAWKTIPSWYMVATQDHAIPPATERFMAQRAHASTVEVDSSHVAMISQPEATTRLILDAADSIR